MAVGHVIEIVLDQDAEGRFEKVGVIGFDGFRSQRFRFVPVEGDNDDALRIHAVLYRDQVSAAKIETVDPEKGHILRRLDLGDRFRRHIDPEDAL